MHGAGEDEVLVDLVGDDDEVAGDRHIGDERQFLGVEHLARRVVRGVEQDHAGPRRHCLVQFLGVEAIATVGCRPQQHGDRPGTGERDARLVAVVHRLEDDHLVVGVEHAEQRTGQRLCCPRGHQHLAVGIVVEAVEATLVPSDRLAQGRDARARRYWLCPERIAATAASSTSAGPSLSGNP